MYISPILVIAIFICFSNVLSLYALIIVIIIFYRAENMARRTAGEDPLPEEDPSNPIFKPVPEPSRLDSFLITNQISNYCNQINGYVINGWRANFLSTWYRYLPIDIYGLLFIWLHISWLKNFTGLLARASADCIWWRLCKRIDIIWSLNSASDSAFWMRSDFYDAVICPWKRMELEVAL